MAKVQVVFLEFVLLGHGIDAGLEREMVAWSAYHEPGCVSETLHIPSLWELHVWSPASPLSSGRKLH